ncbi:MAG: helix-turn-helix domain-containing protein [Coprothermobacter proteolyticus]
MEPKIEKQFYKISEVAEVLGVRYNTVWRLIQNGTIPGVKVGKTWYVPASFFDDLQKQAKKEVV